jgi:polyphosphate kinase 2 (PPK2 family)
MDYLASGGLTVGDSNNIAEQMNNVSLKLQMVQQTYIQKKLKAILVLEGVDAAGKGGLIRRLAWSVDPRALKVWPISAPNAVEKDMHYMWRFWSKLPGPGEISVFDRSWYGRVLVESVEGISKGKAVTRAYQEINEFERWMTDDDVRVIKILLKISKKEQSRRLIERVENPEKNWKLTFDDIRNRNKWDQYETLFEKMVSKTSKKHATWHVVDCDEKEKARIQALNYIIKELSRGVSIKPTPISDKLKNDVRELKKT